MAFGFHVKRFIHRGTVDKNGHVAVQHVHLFCASDTIVLAVQMLDTLMMTHPTRKAVQIMPTSRILFPDA